MLKAHAGSAGASRPLDGFQPQNTQRTQRAFGSRVERIERADLMRVDSAEGMCYTTATSVEGNSILERTSLAKLLARLSAGVIITPG